jgi:hypothetical protein
MKAGVAPAAAAECITASDDRDLQAHAFALGLADTSPYQRRTLVQLSGTLSLDGRMKSIPTNNEISATV